MQQALQSIEESFVSLREVVGLPPTIDWHRANESAAALVVSADAIVSEVQRRVFNNARYDQRFRFDAARHAAAFRGASRRLHEAVVNRHNETLNERAHAAGAAWDAFCDECWVKMSTSDRSHFRELQSRTAGQVVQLQAMLSL